MTGAYHPAPAASTEADREPAERKKIPLDHLLRYEPPWRTQSRTECGRPATDVASVITRDAFAAKIKAQGVQRAAYTTCMTCAERRKDRSWSVDPEAIIARDARPSYGPPRDTPLRRELVALTALYEAHQDEFHDALAGLDAVTTLSPRSSRITMGGAVLR